MNEEKLKVSLIGEYAQLLEKCERLAELYNDALADNELLTKKNEKLLRENFGLKQQVANLKKKEDKRYWATMGGS